MMIFAAAGAIAYAAIERLLLPMMPERLGVGMVISVAAALLNAAVALVLLRAGRQHGSAALIADGKHLLTDIVTTVAVLIGVTLVLVTGQGWLDPVVALIAGLNIAWTGFNVVRSSADSLLDRALPPSDQAAIEQVLDVFRARGVEFHGVRTRVAGTRRFLDVHVVVSGDWTVARGHEVAHQVVDELQVHLPGLAVVTHLEPVGAVTDDCGLVE
jgi:cation diffusion facilitator family transporter